jgi:hypothetical protein
MKRKLILLFLFGVSVCSKAQQAFTNNGNMQIHPGTSITGFGNFTNASSGVLVNNGSLYIRGNATNNQASMAIGSGTLYFNGSSAQYVNGSQTFKTNNLETNNSAGFTLDNDLSISGVHTFTSGLIASSSIPNYLIYEAGSSYAGDNDSRHVIGSVRKIGNTDFIFPVGNATYERVVGISNLSASSEFNCTYNNPTNNTINLFSPLVKVKSNEYWQIDKVSGGNAKVNLNWDHSKVSMDNVLLADIMAAYYNGSNWTDAGGSGTATGNITTTGSVTSNAHTSFGSFTLGYYSYPVPLRLLSFTASRRTGISYLKWITDNENQVDHFDIQRSYDGINFSSIGNKAARNSGFREQYDFEDYSSLKGFAWYRIRSIDIDGKSSFSRIAVVSETDINSASFLVMNPVHTFITIINKTGYDGKFDYRLLNSGGQLIWKGNTAMANNSATVLPVPSYLASGIYIMELSNEKTIFKQQLLLEK